MEHRKEVNLSYSEPFHTCSESDKSGLLKESEISLVLDSYDDIFSDFDSRPYSHRALSQDFLEECKRASRDKDESHIELTLLVPIHKRNRQHEITIKKRLHEHFGKHLTLLKEEKGKVVKQGFFFIAFGIIFMFIAAYTLFHYGHVDNILKEFLIVLLQPGGWFLFWEGLGLMIFETKKTKPQLEFYEKMHRVDIKFLSF